MSLLIKHLFDTGFVPHGYCLRWQSDVVRLHMVSDTVIGLAYFSISLLLARFLRKRRDIRFCWLFAAFAFFILACGATHVMDVVTLWLPVYRIAGVLKAITAAISAGTAVALLRTWPQLLKLPTATQLDSANRALREEVYQHRLTISKLATRDAQCELIFAVAELGDWRWDAVRDEVFAHAIVFRQYGSPEQSGPVPRNWFWARQHPEDIDSIYAKLQEALVSNSNFDLEFRVVHPDGSIRWLACRGSVVRDEYGKPVATHGLSLDITDSKEAEAAMLASQSQLFTLTEVLPQLLWFANPNGEVEFFNRQWYEYTGQTPDQALNWGWQPVIHPVDLGRCLKEWNHSLSSGAAYEIEHRLRRWDGEYRWHLGRALPVRNLRDQIVRWFGSYTDIHDLKCAEANMQCFQAGLEQQVSDRTAALVAATGLNRRILDSSPDCIQVLDKDGYLISSNPAACRALNVEPLYEVPALYWPEIWHADHQTLALEAIEQARHGEKGEFRSVSVPPVGAQKWWDVRITAIAEAPGDAQQFLAVWRDITDQKLAEQAASQAKHRLDVALRAARIGAWTWDLESRQVRWYQHSAAIFGLPSGSLITDFNDFANVIHPLDRHLVQAKLADALETGHYEDEFRVVWPDGTVRFIAASAEVSFQSATTAQLAGVCWDITRRKQAEQALQISESRLREAQEIAQLGHWEFDLTTTQVNWSAETLRIFGLPKSVGVTLERYQAMLPAEDQQRMLAAVQHTIMTGEPYRITHPVLRPDGSIAHVEARGRLEYGASGAPEKLLGTLLDVTHRVEAALALQRSHDGLELRIAERTSSLRAEIAVREKTEKNLREAESQLAVALKFSRVATWVWDAKRDQISWTGPVETLFGRTAAELNCVAAVREVILPEDFHNVSRSLRKAIASGSEYEAEFRIRRPDGTVRWMAGRGGASLEGRSLARVSGVNFDVTHTKEAEQELAASEARFRQLADGMPQIVWTARPDGEVDYANGAWCSYTGMRLEQIAAWGWTPTIHPDDQAGCIAAWTLAFQTGTPYEAEFRVKRASDATYRWHRAHALPIRDADNQIVKWLGTCPDIDDYKRTSAELKQLNQQLEDRVRQRSLELVETERRHRLMIEGVKDYSIVMLDTAGRVTSWNAGAERIKLYTAAEILGKHFSIFYPAEQVAAGHPEHELEVARTEGEFREENWRLKKDGSRFWAHVLITRILSDDGTLTGFSKVVRDLTEQRKAEERILSEQRRAEEASRAKSDFLAAMSHEIRTPMNAILGMADLLWGTELDPVQRQYVEVFRRAGANLLTLVNDILDLSKIESGNFELENIEFDLEELVDRTVDIFRPKTQAKRLALIARIAPGTPCNLLGDPTRLQQILINLLGNAIKFTEQGSITLALGTDLSRPGRLRFEVTDTGIGIPADKLKSIFDDFTQAETSTTRRFGGTGLGLAICRRLVSRMDGSLCVSSTVGKGSSFHFDAQFALGSETKRQEPELQNGIFGKRVLVTDDNATNRLIFAEMCTSWGMEVVECTSAAGMLEALSESLEQARPFDIAIMDRLMPEVRGFEFVSQLRAQYPSLPLILITSDDVPGDATRSRQMGVAGYAVKPVRRSELLRLICLALRASGPTGNGWAAEIPDQASGATPRGRILIAEDSEDNRFLLQAYLKNLPYEITFAMNGELAVDAARSKGFDLILMDMQMPVMDGLAATRSIRTHEGEIGCRPIPILALTANALADDVRNCREAGCTAHLAKPISKQKLVGAIDEYMIKQSHSVTPHSISIDIPAGLEEAARRYLLSRQKEAVEMKQLLAEGNCARLSTLAHNMKGTGTPYGFPMLTELGSELETFAKAGNRGGLLDRLTQLSEYLERAVDAWPV